MTHDWTPCARPLLVLPTYNERDNLESIIRAARDQLPQADVWIVDDNSPDGTGEIAERLAAADPRISVVHRAGKQGLGTAYTEAFARALQADYDCVLQMDADFSHDPRYLPELLAALRGADLVIGSRYVPGGGTQNWSPLRKLISRGGNVVARVGLGVRTRDATGGYRAYRRSTLEQLRLDELRLRGYGFQIEVVFQVEHLGLRVVEVPILFVERVAGRSKMSRGIVLEAMMHILRRRTRMLRGQRDPVPGPTGRYAR